MRTPRKTQPLIITYTVVAMRTRQLTASVLLDWKTRPLTATTTTTFNVSRAEIHCPGGGDRTRDDAIVGDKVGLTFVSKTNTARR